MRVCADWASLLCFCLILGVFDALAPPPAAASVLVVANRSPDSVQFTITDTLGRTRTLHAASGEVIPLPTDFDLELAFVSSGDRKRYTVTPYSVYYVRGDRERGYELEQIGLPSVPRFQTTRRADVDAAHAAGENGLTAAEQNESATPPSGAVITVKILADEEIVGTYRDWTQRLQNRVAAASRILNAHCRLRLQIVSVGTWRSDNSQTDFLTTISEFERQVSLAPAQVVIGFTGQYRRPVGPTKLGGIRGPLRHHILIREWPQHVSERERLELLVHELGHYLGAVHSPETDSVMRPILADRQALYRRFQVRFDPVNTLVLYLVSQGLRNGPMNGLDDLDLRTKLVLRGVYTDMGRAIPDDPTPPKYVRLLQLPETSPRRNALPSRRGGDLRRLLHPTQKPLGTGSR